MILCCALVAASGCAKYVSTIETGKWLAMMVEEGGISSSSPSSDKNAYEQAVVDAVSFGILKDETEVDLAKPLTTETAAYLICNLLDQEPIAYDVRGITDSIYKEQIMTIASLGLLVCDKNGKIDPKEILTEEQAKDILSKSIEILNDPNLIQKEEVILREDIAIKSIQPETFDPVSEQAVFDISSDIVKGDLVQWIDGNGRTLLYEIKDVHTTDKIAANVEVADPLLYTEEMDISGESEIDLSKVEIIDDEENGVTAAPSSFQLRETTIHKHGFDITLNVGSRILAVDVRRTLEHGEDLYASLQLNGIKVKYKWHSSKDLMKGAFFKVSCHTEEDLGVNMESYKKVYGDLSKLDPEHCLASMKDMFSNMSEEPIEVPLCTFRVPIEGTSLLTLKAKLSLRIYAGGRAELTLSQDHTAGLEIRNEKIRTIHEFKHDEEAKIRANTAFTGVLKFAFDFMNKSLMDVGLETGAKAYLHTFFNIYTEDGRKVREEDIPYDIADELTRDMPDLLVCADVNAYWILNVLINSRGTVLNRIGFSTILHLLNSENASIFPGGKVHMENFEVVERCTRFDRKAFKRASDDVQTDRLEIDAYAKAMHVGDISTLQILSLPYGYKKDDLSFCAYDTDIVSIDDDGVICALKPGATKVKVSTSDGKYRVYCSVFVAMEKDI